MHMEMVTPGSGKATLFAKNFCKSSKLDDSGISLPAFHSRTNNPMVVLKNSAIGF